MQRHHDDPTRIEPSEGEDYTEIQLPDTIARQAQSLAGADEPPRTLGDQARLFAKTDAFQAQEAGDVEAMLVADDSRHAVHLGDTTTHTHCFLDALGLGLLHEGSVEVTTRPPGLDETIELTVSREGIRGAHPEMVVAYGFSTGMPTGAAELAGLSQEETLAAMHEHGCPTQNLFPDEDAYEAWASQADAATVPMSLPQALAMVHDYVEDWELARGANGDDIDIRPSDGEGYAERPLPEEISEPLEALTGLTGVEEEVETWGDFAELNAQAEAFSPDEFGVEELLIAEESRHEVELSDGTAHTYCVLDALILGFLEDEPVRITTRPPGSEQSIEMTVSPEGLSGGHRDMVVSFGFSEELPTDPAAFEEMGNEEALEIAHQHGCPQINLFPDRTAYEAWAAVADAVTIPMSLAEALALARDSAEDWDFDDGEPQLP